MKYNNAGQLEFNETSSKTIYFSIIESLLFVSGEPLKLKDIAEIIECDIQYTRNILEEMNIKFIEDNRGIKLININDSYQFVTRPENGIYIQKLLKTNVRQSLSQAALETLAIIAYKQPITRASIDEIRGVKSDRAVITLVEKNLIKESGRLEVIGRPILFSTTDEFLKYFGFENLKNMPSMEDLIKDIQIEEETFEV